MCVFFPVGRQYEGLKYEKGNCGVSIMRSGMYDRRPSTVNFQNNAQVQINAWFKLTPGTKHTVYNLLHCFLYFKRTPGSI